jgi:hypothetical protein
MPLTFEAVEFARFIGYFVSEGSLHSGGDGFFKLGLSQNAGVVQDDMVRSMKSLGLHVRVVGDDGGFATITTSHKSLWTYLEAESGRYSTERRVPVAVKALGREALTAFLDAAMAGDGSTTVNKDGTLRRRYRTVSRSLADDIQEISTRLGFRACIRKWKVGWSVSISERQESWVRQVDVSRSDYDGTVYCFDVPNHLFVTRRNDKVAITGNCAVFQISPQDVGITMDINRANADQQAEGSEDRGLRPLLALIQEYLTREVVWDPSFGGRKNNLAFRFTKLNLKESLNRAQINTLALGKVPWKTINEARTEEGRPPLGPDFDKLIMGTSVGAVSLDEVMSAADAMTKTSATGKEPPEPTSAAKMLEELAGTLSPENFQKVADGLRGYTKGLEPQQLPPAQSLVKGGNHPIAMGHPWGHR